MAPSSNKEVSAALHQPLCDQCANGGGELERDRWSVEVFGGRLKKQGRVE